MGVRVLYDEEQHYACLYDSVSGWAFGPLFNDDMAPDLSAEDAAWKFTEWLRPLDAREPSDGELEEMVAAWLTERERAAAEANDQVDA